MWLHDVEPLLKGASEKLAHWRPVPKVPTLAEIVYHMKFWEEFVMRGLKKESVADMPREQQANGPGQNLSSLLDWDQVRDELLIQHRAFRKFLSDLREYDLFVSIDEVPEAYNPVYRPVYGIILHNSYHLGQLVLLQEMFNAL